MTATSTASAPASQWSSTPSRHVPSAPAYTTAVPARGCDTSRCSALQSSSCAVLQAGHSACVPSVFLIWHPLNYTGETNAAASHEEPAQRHYTRPKLNTPCHGENGEHEETEGTVRIAPMRGRKLNMYKHYM